MRAATWPAARSSTPTAARSTRAGRSRDGRPPTTCASRSAARAAVTTTPSPSPSSRPSRTRCTRSGAGRRGPRPGTRSWGSSRASTTGSAPLHDRLPDPRRADGGLHVPHGDRPLRGRRGGDARRLGPTVSLSDILKQIKARRAGHGGGGGRPHRVQVDGDHHRGGRVDAQAHGGAGVAPARRKGAR